MKDFKQRTGNAEVPACQYLIIFLRSLNLNSGA